MVDSKTVYLQKHSIPELIDSLINKLVDEEPADPKGFLAKCLESRAGTVSENTYSVHLHAAVDGAKLFQRIDFDTIGHATVTGDGKSIGCVREIPGLDPSFQERLVDRRVGEFERSYTYTLNNTNSLDIKGFSGTLRVLSSTVSPASSCFVTWTAMWEQTGELASLHLPTFMRELIEGAVAEAMNDP